MFVDYYALLEISLTATSDEIKTAFKKQALKWHPDRNPGVDTTAKMQLLNEAKLILLDTEAREKYDYQYRRFKQYQQEKTQSKQYEYEQQQTQHQQQHQHQQRPFTETYTETGFDIDDDVLKKWMSNARRQAVDLAKQTIEELKGMTKAGVKAGAKAMGNAFLYQLVFSVIVLIIIGISKGCN
ncbi:MAG: J domain-containing protein [Bacteroidetes bacterium]|nr:J domain-containing protein [Bacteroidota bacterium]